MNMTRYDVDALLEQNGAPFIDRILEAANELSEIQLKDLVIFCIEKLRGSAQPELVEESILVLWSELDHCLEQRSNEIDRDVALDDDRGKLFFAEKF